MHQFQVHATTCSLFKTLLLGHQHELHELQLPLMKDQWQKVIHGLSHWYNWSWFQLPGSINPQWIFSRIKSYSKDCAAVIKAGFTHSDRFILTISRPKFINVSPPGMTLRRAIKPPSMASLQEKRRANMIKFTGRKQILGEAITNTTQGGQEWFELARNFVAQEEISD